MADATTELDRASADIPLTRDAREILSDAATKAAARGTGEVTAADLMHATLMQRGSRADEAIHALGLDPKAIAEPPQGEAAERSIPVRQLLVNAGREAQAHGHYQVDSIHLLVAMLYSDSPTTSIPLQKAGLTLYDLRRHLQTGAPPAAPVGERGKARPDAALRRRPLPSLRGVLTISPVFGGLVAFSVASGLVLWFGILPGLSGAFTIAFVTAGWITTLCVHEFGHALVAYLGGDRAVAASGYLTLDPLRYSNLLLSLIMPIVFLLLGGIALPGGAVYIDRGALRSKSWDSAVSAAGPFGTLLCGLAIGSPFLFSGYQLWIAHSAFFAALAFLGFVEAFALILNLLPIPGLDGFGILRPWLPYSTQAWANQFGAMAILGVFVVLWFVAPVRDAFFQAVLQLTSVMQIDPRLVVYGQSQMRLF
jgi:Zn-dependent protease